MHAAFLLARLGVALVAHAGGNRPLINLVGAVVSRAANSRACALVRPSWWTSMLPSATCVASAVM